MYAAGAQSRCFKMCYPYPLVLMCSMIAVRWSVIHFSVFLPFLVFSFIKCTYSLFLLIFLHLHLLHILGWLLQTDGGMVKGPALTALLRTWHSNNSANKVFAVELMQAFTVLPKRHYELGSYNKTSTGAQILVVLTRRKCSYNVVTTGGSDVAKHSNTVSALCIRAPYTKHLQALLQCAILCSQALYHCYLFEYHRCHRCPCYHWSLYEV